MNILLIILCLIAKYMNEADAKFWLIDTLDEKADTNEVQVETKNNDYQQTLPPISIPGDSRRQGGPGPGDTATTDGSAATTESAPSPSISDEATTDGSAATTESAPSPSISDEAATTSGPESTTGSAIDNQMSSCETPVTVKEADSLTPEERNNLFGAMKSMYETTDVWFDLAGMHGRPLRPACAESDENYCCQHGQVVGEADDEFLPWHRLYLAYANAALRRSSQEATVIPYWDWTTGVEYPSIAQSSDSPFFQALKNSTDSSIRNTNTNRGNTALSADNTYLERVLNALGENDFRLFNNQLESVHNSIHTAVGGDMGGTDYAAFDPIFWLHHAMVDLIWAVQQTLKPDVRPDRGFDTSLVPFGLRGTDTFQCHNYNLETGIVFGNMTLAQIRDNISGRNGSSSNADYQDQFQDKVYAGFFLHNFGMSGVIRFNICKSVNNYQSENCSIPAGELAIFGGPYERKTYSSLPYKVDVTEAVKKAGLNATSMCRFKVWSFHDRNGTERPDKVKEIYQPITVFRSVSEQKDTYLFAFNKEGPQAHDITIHKGCSYQISSEKDDVDENQDCYGNSTNSANSKKEWPSYREWQQTNPDKYQRWNKKGEHLFSSNICNDQSYRGSKMKINCE